MDLMPSRDMSAYGAGTVTRLTAEGRGSHAEGYGTYAFGAASHAEGSLTSAIGGAAHSEGNGTIAVGAQAHAEGYQTQAKERSSHSEGVCTIASARAQHVQGAYNIEDTAVDGTTGNGTYLHIVGNGTASKRSNAHTIDWQGNAWFSGRVTIGPSQEELATKKDIDLLQRGPQYLYATIPMHSNGGWAPNGDEMPTHHSVRVSVLGLRKSDHPKIAINYTVLDEEQGVLSAGELDTFPILYGYIKTMVVLDDALVVYIPDSVHNSLESGLAGEVPIILEVWR